MCTLLGSFSLINLILCLFHVLLVCVCGCGCVGEREREREGKREREKERERVCVPCGTLDITFLHQIIFP